MKLYNLLHDLVDWNLGFKHVCTFYDQFLILKSYSCSK